MNSKIWILFEAGVQRAHRNEVTLCFELTNRPLSKLLHSEKTFGLRTVSAAVCRSSLKAHQKWMVHCVIENNNI